MRNLALVLTALTLLASSAKAQYYMIGTVQGPTWMDVSQAPTAPGKIMFGDVHVTPHATLSEGYDDNIFLAPKDVGTRDSQILHLILGTGFTVEGARSKLYLGYDLGLLHYDRFSNQNDAVEHTAVGGAKYDLANGGFLALDEKFLATTDPASSEVVARAKRDQNDLSARVEFPLGSKFYVSGMALDTIQDYLHDPLRTTFNRNEFSAGPRLGFNMSEKTRLFAEYRYMSQVYDIDQTRNSNTNFYSVGASGDFTSRITGGLQVGETERQYNNDIPGNTKDKTTPYAMGQLKWNAPHDYNVVLTGSRQFVESLFNRYYIASGGALSLSKQFTENWNGALLAGYEVDDYPDTQTVPEPNGSIDTGARQDKLTQAGVTIGYRFPEVYKVTLQYLYRHRASNFDAFTFNDNVVSLALGMEF